MRYHTNLTTAEILERVIQDANLPFVDDQLVRREFDGFGLTDDSEDESIKLTEKIDDAKENLEDLITNINDQQHYRANEQTIAELEKLLDSLK